MVYINSSTSGTDSTRSRCNSKNFMCISVNTACHNGMYLHHCALCSLSPNTHMNTDSGNNNLLVYKQVTFGQFTAKQTC